MSARHFPPAPVRHGWFAREWLKTLKRKQADACRGLDISKATMSELVNGKQRYNQDVVEGLADFLNISPYELLMHPQDAMNLRQLRHSANQIARMNAIRDVIPVGPDETVEPSADEAKPKRRAS